MAIAEGDYIRLNYTGMVNGVVFDTTSAETAREAGIENSSANYGPILVRVGSGHVIPGLDEALVGREPGEEAEVDVPPEKGFGEYRRDLVEGIPLKKFGEKVQIGSRVRNENREGVVRDIIGNRAIVDFNDRLAGETLHYRFTVVEVVEDGIERARGLVRLYSGYDLTSAFESGILTFDLTPGINYDRRWILWKPTIVRDVFEAAPDVLEIRFLETYKRPEPAKEE
ncbi:MAG TPA: peptidylprolyl isomerase [Methanoregulaceae archaeon]|nr:peptidylprolyl isomerase [Methanoregulaceae archaeon]HQJ86988.1 peptidylprolyl isomerase [Methanoregulaceae archaeon]